ncbi:hypothetical protein Tco_0886753 [Tanacetum coccineum]
MAIKAQVVSGIVNKTANNTIWSVVSELVWGATYNYIWQERNIRLFGNDGRSSEELFKVIFESVRSRLMGLKLKVTPDVINAAEIKPWGVLAIAVFSPETYEIALGMDNGWHRYGSMSSCLRFLAYGDVLNYAGWSQYSLVIQSVLITLAILNSQSIADDYASLLIYSLTEFYSSIKKGDVCNEPVWVKFHDILITTFTEDVLSATATKLGTLLIINSYTTDICLESLGRLSYATAMIESWAEVDLKDTLVIDIPKFEGEGYTRSTIHVEYEWKPPKSSTSKVFGHVLDECHKKIV